MKRSGDEKAFRKISAIKDSILMNKKNKRMTWFGDFLDKFYNRISFINNKCHTKRLFQGVLSTAHPCIRGNSNGALVM